MLKPLNFNRKSNGTALVELREKGTGAIETPDRQYKSFNRGIVIEVMDTHNLEGWKVKLVGKEVFFEEFKDSAQVEEDDKTYAFIALDDIKGYIDEI